MYRRRSIGRRIKLARLDWPERHVPLISSSGENGVALLKSNVLRRPLSLSFIVSNYPIPSHVLPLPHHHEHVPPQPPARPCTSPRNEVPDKHFHSRHTQVKPRPRTNRSCCGRPSTSPFCRGQQIRRDQRGR